MDGKIKFLADAINLNYYPYLYRYLEEPITALWKHDDTLHVYFTANKIFYFRFEGGYLIKIEMIERFIHNNEWRTSKHLYKVLMQEC